ncbi:MAG: nucleotidyltransferase family protein [Clostridia bacterium]|nr:nucleotidyltransferase family protein [Clostridia bacterium]
MKICGIICEYNPLHKGHIYQINKARQLTGADYVVCIMSGSFVQRGENAVFDKFSRAKAAVESGADACLELPQIFALQSAQYFALGGVLAADTIGCTHLCFGSECGDLTLMQDFSEPETFRESLASGASYGNSLSAFEGQPNSMLGREYLKAIDLIKSDIKPVTLLREPDFASASRIRSELLVGSTNKEMYPFNISPVFFEKFFPIIKYKLITMSAEELSNVCGVSEGLEHKIKKEILCSNSLDELIHNIKSKRYTYSRISRILCCALLDITKDKLTEVIKYPPKLKLLAIKKEKTALLSILDNYYISPLDSQNYDKSTEISSSTNVLATHVYSVMYPGLLGDEDYTLGLMKV